MAWFKWVSNDEVVVSKDAIADAIENGVLRKANQQKLSQETGIRIKVFVGGQKNR